MNQVVLPESLTEIADRIRDRNSRITEDIYENGRDLTTAKELCKHGEWLLFLEKTGTPPRTAQAMMQYAREINDNPRIDRTKALPSMRSVLGANTQRAAHLESDVDKKLQDEAEQRERGRAEYDARAEEDPDKVVPMPKPSRKKLESAMQSRIDELEAENEDLRERIAFMLEDDPGRTAVLEFKIAEIRTLRSQLMNEQEKVRRLNAQVKHLKKTA